MKKLLIVIDMQNDFITGSLGSRAAAAIIPAVDKKIGEYRKNSDDIIFTRDTHSENYSETLEGKFLPVPHCIEGTKGHLIANDFDTDGCRILDKPNFGSLELAQFAAQGEYDEIELCGVCTDICVVSNALILKAKLPETIITVDALCCAGVSDESHKAALVTMKMCQVSILNVEL